MKKKVILPEQSLTFSDYAKLRVSTEDVFNYFGYTKKTERLQLPTYTGELPNFDFLNQRIEEHIVHISLENELTRREFLIAPVISEVRHLTQAKLNSEYWFEYNHQLKGSFDYLFRAAKNLVVVEAKQADLTHGFTQLGVELIAVDKADESDKPLIYGLLTTGIEWQFAVLERDSKVIKQHLDLYVLPGYLENILRILIGILEK
jgi:hypothetical protein